MQDIYTTSPRAQTQPALGSTIPSLSSYGSSISQSFARSAGKPGRVFAHIEETVKRRRLKKAQGGTEGGLRAHYIVKEANGRGRKRPVVSAPMIQPQQLILISEPCSGDTKTSSQKRIQRSRLANQHEALGLIRFISFVRFRAMGRAILAVQHLSVNQWRSAYHTTKVYRIARKQTRETDKDCVTFTA